MIVASLVGCSEPPETQVLTDPISNESNEFTVVRQSNWTLYSAVEGQLVILARDGKPVVSVMESHTGRIVSISAGSEGLGRVEVVDENHDGNYDLLRYGNGSLEITDRNLNGVVDSILDFETATMLVHYEGELIELQGSGPDKYIEVEGERIKLQYQGGVFVPIEE